ncbi:hypothetical protein ACTWPB_18875 [Nocardia sp. IBHARD005]|uniref:hypothetical protein n=1 Tax=Nocardia sp. IBHARD005 TaxID=3457765 RepID=UPI004058D1AB
MSAASGHAGHGALGLLNTYLVDGDHRLPRWSRVLLIAGRHPVQTVRLQRTNRWNERTLVLLVMQSLDNSVATYTRRGVFGRRFTSKQGFGEPNPSWIPPGHEATHHGDRRAASAEPAGHRARTRGQRAHHARVENAMR